MTERTSDDRVESALSLAKRFAALSGPFNPTQALRVAGAADLGADRLTLVATRLAELCDPTTQEPGRRWLMRGSERRSELELLTQGADGTLTVAEAVAWRQQTETDEATDDLLHALTGQGLFSHDSLMSIVEGSVLDVPLRRVAEALARAGTLAPESSLLPLVRAAVARVGLQSNIQSVLERGFYGRQVELARTREWAQRPSGQKRIRALYIKGQPGVGKSTLLDETGASLAQEPGEWLIVRLDFDRAGLDVLDWLGLTLELLRQVAAQLGGEGASYLQQARDRAVNAASSEGRVKGQARQSIYRLGSDLAAVTATSGGDQRHVLVILDTLEVLRSRGETQPEQLFKWLDELASSGVPLSVIAAGRGNALSTTARRADTLDLGGLDPASADQLLGALGVEADHFEALRTITGGNPLSLRFAARIAREGNIRELTRQGGGGNLTAAILYRFLLSRIDDEELRQVANPGLVVRVINPDVIRDVLAPAVGLGRIAEEKAKSLFDRLATQHWLVTTGPSTPGFVRHRSDIREELLPVLYQSAPAKCADIDRRAVRWFAQRPEPWAAVEAAYHRLQLMRRDSRRPALDAAVVAQLDETSLSELPRAAQNLVARARGQRTSDLRGGATGSGGQIAEEAVIELRSLNDRGDWLEGQYVYERGFSGATFDARSEAGDVARTFLWRSGRWREALRLLRERDTFGEQDTDLLDLYIERPLDAACRLEMRAESQFDALVQSLRLNHELVRAAASLVDQDLRSSLGAGALRLALEASDRYASESSSSLDPAGAASRWWPATGGRNEPLPGPRPEEGAGWERIRRRVGDNDVDVNGPVGRARILAALTPYADVVATLNSTAATDEPDGAFAFIQSMYQRVEALGLLAPASTPPWHELDPPVSPLAALNSMTDVGLLAEGIGAAGYILGHADLNLVARSAERWRRTMAGSWSFGSPSRSGPPGWRLVLDVSLEDRLAMLRDSDDWFAQCQAQLDAWGNNDGATDRVIDLILKRAPATTAKAAAAARQLRGYGDDPSEPVARILLNRVPSAFLPPLVVLFERSALDAG